MSHWSWTVTTPWLVLACMVWILTAVLGWIHWRRRGGWGSAVLEMLRLGIVSMILLTLCQPERVEQKIIEERPRIVVMHDGSDSMQTRDVVGKDGEVLSRHAWLEATLGTNFWESLAADTDVMVEQFARAPWSTNQVGDIPATDLNQALEAVLDREENLKAILLLSDGDWNTGQTPLVAATRLRAAQVPLFTLAVGRETPLPDLVLESVAAPSYGLLGEQISIPFRVRSFLNRDVPTTVVLRGDSGAVVRKEILIPAQGHVQESILWMPRSVGDMALRLSLPLEEEEYLSENNQRTFRMSIRTDKLRVLVVDSWPRWEYRYLRNALERDPGVDVQCLLFHPGLGPGQGTNYLDSFPATPEALSPYDVVFLGDVGVDGSELTPAHLTLLRGLVEQQASGLVFLPGRRGRQATLLGTPLEELLPVIMDANNSLGLASAIETGLQLTLSGQSHFLTMLTGSESRNATTWKGLPGFYWCAMAERAKPGSEVLAVHPSRRNTFGRLPLLVIRPFGNGEVLFMGTDSAWRWRRGVEDRYHYRFWGQVVRWMAHKRHMAEGTGLRFTYNPENPSTGDRVFFQTTALDLARWSEKMSLNWRLVTPSERAEQSQLLPMKQGWGVYQGSFMPEESGTYRLQFKGDGSLLKLETEIEVNPIQTEIVGRPAQVDLLGEMAALTRGASGGPGRLLDLVRQISVLPEAEPLEIRFRLWSNAWWGGAIVFLMALYWSARKAAGLI